jgi:hypothetical protein
MVALMRHPTPCLDTDRLGTSLVKALVKIPIWHFLSYTMQHGSLSREAEEFWAPS